MILISSLQFSFMISQLILIQSIFQMSFRCNWVNQKNITKVRQFLFIFLKEQSLEEFVQRLRFNQVSVRMQLFIKFHNNNLDNVINELVKVFRNLLVAEETFNTRFHDLLNQKHELNGKLIEFETLRIKYESQQKDDSEYEVLREEDFKMKSISQEFEKQQIIQETFKIDSFFINFFSFISQSLSRLISTMYVIKEYLRTQYSIGYISRWIENPVFDQVRQIQNYLAQKFSIQTVTQSLSQQTWNQIYQNLKNDKRTKKNDQLKECKLRNLIFSYFNFQKQEVDEIIQFFLTDQIFNSFGDLKIVQKFFISLREDIQSEKQDSSFESIRNLIYVDGKQIFLHGFFLKIQGILNGISGLTLQIRVFKQKGIPKMQKKPTFRQVFFQFYYMKLLEKHIVLINEQSLDMGQSIIQKKIEEFEAYQGLKSDDSISTEIQSEIKKADQSSQKEDVPQTPSQMKCDPFKKKYQKVNIEQVPIFNFLNSKHRINKKLMLSSKQNIKTMLSTHLRIDECESPLNYHRRSKKRLTENFNSIHSYSKISPIAAFPTLKTEQPFSRSDYAQSRSLTKTTITPISKKILTSSEFYLKQWVQQCSPTSDILQQKKSTASIRSVYRNQQSLNRLSQEMKRKSVPEKMFTTPSYCGDDDKIDN